MAYRKYIIHSHVGIKRGDFVETASRKKGGNATLGRGGNVGCIKGGFSNIGGLWNKGGLFDKGGLLGGGEKQPVWGGSADGMEGGCSGGIVGIAKLGGVVCRR